MSYRSRTPSNIVGYGLYLYFLGLSFRNTAKALSFLNLAKNKPRFYLELDSKVQALEISKEKENQ